MDIKIKISLLLGLCMFVLRSYGQSSPSKNENYIKVKYYLDSVGILSSDKIIYYDALGRESEILWCDASSDHKDIATLKEYDSFGRETNSWQPVQTLTSGGSYMSPETLKAQAVSYYGDSAPFSSHVYESSPESRLLEKYGSGEDWRQKNKAVRYTYAVNNDSEEYRVMQLTVNSDDWRDWIFRIKKAGYYNPESLRVSVTQDEDHHTCYIFTNSFGDTVLERKKLNDDFVDTYYIYDSCHHLLAVLPPLASEMMEKEYDQVDCELELEPYAYIYLYNGRGECVAKKMPGAAFQYLNYDKNGNLTLTRDGNGNTIFHIYDSLNRLCLEGTCSVKWHSNMEMSNCMEELNVKAERSSQGPYFGYKIVNMGNQTLSDIHILTVHYYDTYDYLSESYFPSAYRSAFSCPVSELSSSVLSSPKGSKTGEISALLDEEVKDSYIYKTVYYNSKGLPIINYASSHLGGYTSESLAYDYAGHVVNRKTYNRTDKTNAVTEHFAYSYDKTGRLISTSYTLNNGLEKQLISNAYDEVGRLSSHRQGNSNDLKTNYQYNVRNQITRISNHVFQEKLYYNIPRSSSSTACYNGNISSISYGYSTALQKVRELSSYDYFYDRLDRLVQADYEDYTGAKSLYDTSYQYDKHGNIITLFRNNIEPESGEARAADDAIFYYSGNQLLRYDDIGFDLTSKDITLPGKTSANTNQFSYDRNGNMTANTNKGITKITYNLLNLPSKIYFSNGSMISYLYDASGKKRSVEYGTFKYIITIPSSGITTKKIYSSDIQNYQTNYRTDYDGRYEYEYMTNNGSMWHFSVIHVDGALVQDPTGSSPIYAYQITDHLGNVRYISKNGRNLYALYAYYPYGGNIDSGNRGDFKERYNGKELDSSNGLDTYDYLARMYDPSLGRFMSVDPLCWKYYSISPYVYCADNPVKHVDPDGRKIIPFLYRTIDSNKPEPYTSMSNFITAMEIFGQTEFGRQVLSELNHPGVTHYGVSGKNSLDDITLDILEFNMPIPLVGNDPQLYYLNDGNGKPVYANLGLYSVDGQLAIEFHIDARNRTVGSYLETIIHEFTFHLGNFKEILKKYREEGANSAVNEYYKTSEEQNHFNSKNKTLYDETSKEALKDHPECIKDFNSNHSYYE